MVWQLSNVNVCSLCWGIGHPFLNFTINCVGLFGYGNCQMLMSVVRVEVSDIHLNLFCLRTFLGFFRYIHYHCFTRALAPYTLLKITPLVLILLFPFIKLCLVWNSFLYMGNHKINLRFRKILLFIDFYPSFVTIYTETVSKLEGAIYYLKLTQEKSLSLLFSALFFSK